ncbi:hypothetical protein I7I50_09481 [Histoplasma capsulatum G186AR]|uniref:Uncharacterized protein n=1 Tax=Ajellomyces capsulatus TaxID=5037 RepID=A0A8H8CZN4_AJECA|nr:hypothetical protein I7I52_07002 [Histoplasma capsulatum]QSS74354.1 hypothetical protein I7I50_09481 [Histoplasma capsulatum G186AR]
MDYLLWCISFNSGSLSRSRYSVHVGKKTGPNYSLTRKCFIFSFLFFFLKVRFFLFFFGICRSMEAEA